MYWFYNSVAFFRMQGTLPKLHVVNRLEILNTDGTLGSRNLQKKKILKAKIHETVQIYGTPIFKQDQLF